MSIKNVWTLPCSIGILDRVTNNVSLINVIEQMNVPTLPVSLPPFYVVAQWQNGTDMVRNATIRIEIIETRSGASTTISEEKVTLNGRTGHRSFVIVNALRLESAGEYRVATHWRDDGTTEWHRAFEYPFRVVDVAAQQSGLPSA